MNFPIPQESPLEQATKAIWQLAQDARSHIALGNFAEADTTLDTLRHFSLNHLTGPHGAHLRAKRDAQVEDICIAWANALQRITTPDIGPAGFPADAFNDQPEA